jgi:hypothetical protein
VADLSSFEGFLVEPCLTKKENFMNTQCPFESSSRRSLKTAASKLITATLAVIAICLLSNNSAQAQESKRKTTICGSVSAQEVSTTDLLTTPQTEVNPGFRGGPAYFDGGGFMYSMIGNLLSSMYSYTTPSAAITDPEQTLEYESTTAQTGPGTAPCRVASTSTGTR